MVALPSRQSSMCWRKACMSGGNDDVTTDYGTSWTGVKSSFQLSLLLRIASSISTIPQQTSKNMEEAGIKPAT